MKAILKYTSILMGLAMAVASCETVDYPDRFRETAGVPTVHYVRYADRDIVITQGFMEEVVCLVGENLTSVHDLYFNDQLYDCQHVGRERSQEPAQEAGR